jgi:hypothetical protein
MSSVLFASCSRRFEQLDPKPLSINLVADLQPKVDISSDAVKTFIDFCQTQPFEVTKDTFAALDTLAEHWEVDDLKVELTQFVRDHPADELVFERLERAIGRGEETAELVAIVHDNFEGFLADNRLLRLPLSILNRVMNYEVQDKHFDELFALLKKCLTIYGSRGSVLFRGLNLNRLRFEDIQFLSEGCGFLWSFVDSSISQVISGLANEALKHQFIGDVSVAKVAREVAELRELVGQSTAELRVAREISDKIEGHLRNVEESHERLYRGLQDEVGELREVIEATAASREADEQAHMERIDKIHEEIRDAERETERKIEGLVKDQREAHEELLREVAAQIGATGAAREAGERAILERIDKVQGEFRDAEQETGMKIETLMKDQRDAHDKLSRELAAQIGATGAAREAGERRIADRINKVQAAFRDAERETGRKIVALGDHQDQAREALSREVAAKLDAEAVTRGEESAKAAQTTRELREKLNVETMKATSTNREVRELSKRVTVIESDVELHRSSLIVYGCLCSDAQKDWLSAGQGLIYELAHVRKSGDKPAGVRLFLFESVSGRGGVLEWLRSPPDRPFDRRVHLSQSSNDLLNLVDPDSTDTYGSSSFGKCWIEFRFHEMIMINRMRIKSSTIGFLRSFDICFGSFDSVLISIRDADLNGPGKQLEITFREILTTQLKIKQTGANWEGQQFFVVNKIEFFSPDAKYSEGVFRTLFRNHRPDIRKFIEVRARDFDLEEIHKPGNRTNVCTWRKANEWLQIEIVGGTFAISCYRLKRSANYKLRSWSLRGSNNASCPLGEWRCLDHWSEAREGEFADFNAFMAVGGPFRYFRLVCDGPKWDGSLMLTLDHIDLYGVFVAD